MVTIVRRRDYRVALNVFIWIQAWLTVPWLAHELPLPWPLGMDFVWDKAWAALLLPSLITVLVLIQEVAQMPRSLGHGLLVIGTLFDTLYLIHNLPPPLRTAMLERWLAAIFSLGAVTWASDVGSDNSSAGLEILAALSLMLTFVAGPRSALCLSIGVLLATLWMTRRPSKPFV